MRALIILIATAAPTYVEEDYRALATEGLIKDGTIKFNPAFHEKENGYLAERIRIAEVKHGQEIIAAVEKCGPGALFIAENAGEYAPRAIAIMNHYGSPAMWAMRNPQNQLGILRASDVELDALFGIPASPPPAPPSPELRGPLAPEIRGPVILGISALASVLVFLAMRRKSR